MTRIEISFFQSWMGYVPPDTKANLWMSTALAVTSCALGIILHSLPLLAAAAAFLAIAGSIKMKPCVS